MEENMQKRLWNILIENELYRLLEFAKNKNEQEEFIKEFSEHNKIPMDFVKQKLQKKKTIRKEEKDCNER